MCRHVGVFGRIRMFGLINVLFAPALSPADSLWISPDTFPGSKVKLNSKA